MEERFGTQSAVHQRPTRANKLLQGLSHFKGIIRKPGRKVKDDRDLDRYPYSSRTSASSNNIMKPYMSQPLLGLAHQASKFSQHDGDLFKISAFAERPSSHEETGMQNEKMPPSIPSIMHQDLPSRTSIQNINPDPLLPRSPSPQTILRRFAEATQSVPDGSRKSIDASPSVVTPLSVQETASTTPAHSATTTPSLSHKAQPVSEYPTTRCDKEHSSTANSVPMSSNSATVKTGSLLNTKRSFSQLRLNVKIKQNSDLRGSNSKPSAKSTNTPPASISVVTPSLSSKSLPPTPPAKSAGTPPISSLSVSSTTTKTSTAFPSNPRTPASMPTVSSRIHKPLPPTGGTLPNVGKDEPPKLTLAPLSHRLSFNIKTPTLTESGLARLSPTIITRPPPLPLLNLPTLTPRSDSLTEASTVFNFGARGRMKGNGKVGEGGVRSNEDRERSLRKSLKSMPALPRRGSGWGVRAHEEADDYDYESVDEEDDDDENASRIDVTSAGLLVPGVAVGGMRSNFASSTSSLGSVDHRDNLLPPSLSGRGKPNREEDEEAGTFSSGESSYHSARSTAYPSPRPELAAVSRVPRIKYPTPPHGYGKSRGHAAPSQVAASAPAPQPSGIQNRSTSHVGPSRLASYDSQPGLPEVDAAMINRSSLSSSSPSPTVIDVKGKGKARDHSASYFSSASGSIVTGGTTPIAASLTNQAVIGAFDPYSYHADDPSSTPIATTARYGFSYRGSGQNDMHAHVQSQKRLDKLNSRGSLTAMPNEVGPSPTGTVRQYESYASGTVGGGNANKGEGGGGETGGEQHISEQIASTAGSQISPSALQNHSHSHNSPLLITALDSLSQNRPTLLSRHSTYHHPSTRNPPNTSPASSFGLATPKAGFSGMRYSVDHSSSVATTRRSSNMLNVGPGGDGNTGFKRPKMYQRASQSMIDIHTLETKEKRKQLEEEARANEERELMKLKQKKKRDLDKKKKMREEQAKYKEDEKLKDDYEKVKADDDTSAEAKEREDKMGAPVKTSLPSKNANTSTATSPTTEGSSGVTKRLSHLRRRRSMPMFDATSEPPPYPSFTLLHTSPTSRYVVMPREDEGQEQLPPYSNNILLRAIMPRKLEFSSPGVQAKDRKWRRVMCVLEGTALKVYKAPRGHAGVGVLGEWWEKQVGAGDVSLQPSHPEGVSNIQIETREARRAAEERRDLERQIQRIVKMEGGDMGSQFESVEEEVVVIQPPRETNNLTPTRTLKTSRSRSKLSQLLKPGKSHSRSKSDAQQSERSAQSPSPRPSLNTPRNSGTSTPASGSLSPFPGNGSVRAQTPLSSSSQSMMDSTSTSGHTTTPTSTTAHSTFLRQQQQPGGQSPPRDKCLFTNREKSYLPDPDPADLVKVYSLQNAESGIGNDYLKRRNVIRLRLEGEQFLLQARDVTGVVEWIEALQAATNIALDLDERPMPRGPLFPRRRRRRRVPGSSADATGISTVSGSGSATINVTSIANMPLPVATV